jgi:hypothetical protein
MTKLLFTVLESFNISGRGVSVITDQTCPKPTFRNSDSVESHRTDVSIILAPCLQEIACRTEQVHWGDRLAARGGWLIVDEAFIDATPEHSMSSGDQRTGSTGSIMIGIRGK